MAGKPLATSQTGTVAREQTANNHEEFWMKDKFCCA